MHQHRRLHTLLGHTRKQAISLREVCTEPDGDYYLEVTSPSKAKAEASMHRQWRSATVGSKPYPKERFEEELEKANVSIGKKGGTKKYEKVIECVARAQGKYPSISQYYDIEYIRSETNPDNMERVEWTIRDLSALESGHGVYFLRTNIRTFDEKTTWDYYNLIREIECSNYDKFIVMQSSHRIQFATYWK